MLIHLSGGLIEMHFHFFVMVVVVSRPLADVAADVVTRALRFGDRSEHRVDQP